MAWIDDVSGKGGPVRVAALWGGGLGDLLVLRPFASAMRRAGAEVRLLTTADHLSSESIASICADISLVRLPRNIAGLIPVIREQRGRFDLVYLGPYPGWRTRLLGVVLGGGRCWSRRHRHVPPFILEQVRADVDEMGLGNLVPGSFPYGAMPWNGSAAAGADMAAPYLAVHMTSKDRWMTHRWPLPRWRALLERVLRETALSVCVLGVDEELEQIRSVFQDLPAAAAGRVSLHLSLPLPEVCGLISASRGVICHNSGILHLSTLLKKQTVCLTGSSAAFWRPPYPWVRNITSGRCDLACNRYECPVPFFAARCIRDLTVDDVWRAVDEHILRAV